MDLPKLRLPTRPGSSSASTTAAGRPTVFTSAQMYSVPLASASRMTSSTLMPFFLQNPSAALVGAPSLKARSAGGPRARSTLSGWPAARPATTTARRRGVPSTDTESYSRPSVLRSAGTAACSCLIPLSTSWGGSSSEPISSTKSRASVPDGASTAGALGMAASGTMPMGNSSSSRRSTQSLDTWRARVRMVPKSLARSVTPTAPRASSTLKAWLSLRMWS
mmetsp:Transcript_8601/g.28160  ORF Transcript_8601/g.28160 Transcript_8601/m.28160 type:complete len:221 (+) Transcript_8601:309-971(+)